MVVALILVDATEPRSTPHRQVRDTMGLEADQTHGAPNDMG
jgi:hypothetical protein